MKDETNQKLHAGECNFSSFMLHPSGFNIRFVPCEGFGHAFVEIDAGAIAEVGFGFLDAEVEIEAHEFKPRKVECGGFFRSL